MHEVQNRPLTPTHRSVGAWFRFHRPVFRLCNQSSTADAAVTAGRPRLLGTEPAVGWRFGISAPVGQTATQLPQRHLRYETDQFGVLARALHLFLPVIASVHCRSAQTRTHWRNFIFPDVIVERIVLSQFDLAAEVSVTAAQPRIHNNGLWLVTGILAGQTVVRVIREEKIEHDLSCLSYLRAVRLDHHVGRDTRLTGGE